MVPLESSAKRNLIRDRSLGLVLHVKCITVHYLKTNVDLPSGSYLHMDSFLRRLQEAFEPEVMNQLVDMIDDEIHRLGLSPLANVMKLTFVQSGYIHGGFVSSLSDCGKVNGTVVLKHKRNYTVVQQRVFGISLKRTDQGKKQIFVILHACDDGSKDALQIDQVLLLFPMTNSVSKITEKYAFASFRDIGEVCVSTLCD